MQITNMHNDLRFAEGLINQVADEYMKALNNNMIFAAKLANVNVSIEPIIVRTAGVTGTIGNGSFDCYLKMFIHSGDSKEFITFVIAHEFAHLLMINMNDVLRLTNRAADGTTSYTAVGRIASSGKVYGSAFEEAIADRLALYIVSRIYGNDGVERLKKDLTECEASQLEIIDMLSETFGDELEKNGHIDEYVTNEDGGYISNMFWYKLVTFDFGTIIDIYNRVMDDHKAFYNLDRILDDYAQEENKEIHAKLVASIKKFHENLEKEA